MKKVLVTLLTAILVLSFGACGSTSGSKTEGDVKTDENVSSGEKADEDESASGGETKDFSYKVGFINIQDTDPNCSWTADVFKEYVSSDEFAKAIGYDKNVEVSWLDSENSVEKQTGHFENLIAQNVDMIFCIGVNNDGNAIGVKKCNEAGIPIYMVVMEASSGEYKHVGFSEMDFGRLQGEYVAENAEEGAKVFYLQGTQGLSSAAIREESFLKALDDAGRDDIEIVAKQDGDYLAETAMQITEDWITSYGDDLEWIVSADNQMVLGACNALEAAGLKDVQVIGCITGGTWDLELVQDGKMQGASYVNFGDIGKLSGEVAKSTYLGEEVAEQNDIEMVFITQDNWTEYFEQ